MATRARRSKGAGVPPGEQGAIASRLPGEGAIDEALVARAVLRINGIHSTNALQTAQEIGEYLLGAFFGDDLDAFRRSGKRHQSFRALSERPELAVGHTTLWYSVALLRQLRQLPAEVGNALPMSHHRLLMPVKDETVKLALAHEALDQGLAKREFEQRVRDVRRGGKRVSQTTLGRPPLPAWAKGVGRIREVIEATMAERVSVAQVKGGADVVKDRLGEVEVAITLLEAFRAKLVAALSSEAVQGQGNPAPSGLQQPRAAGDLPLSTNA